MSKRMNMRANEERIDDDRQHIPKIKPGTRFRLDGTLWTTNGAVTAKGYKHAYEIEAFALDGSTPMQRRFLALRVQRAIKAHQS